MLHQQKVGHCHVKTSLIVFVIRKKIKEFHQETESEIAKKLLTDFSVEIKKFVQVCPKEMLDKLEHPISIISEKKSA